MKNLTKAKPQREPVDTTATIPMYERRWIDIEPSEPSLAAYEVSKKGISLLRHNQTAQREKDGVIEFYKIKFYLRNQFSQVQYWSDERWKACLAAGGGLKEDISIVLVDQRSGFKQKTKHIFLALWSKRQRSWRSWTSWLLCTTSSTIRAHFFGKASRRGILGWHWPCVYKVIDILSNTIECNYSSRNISSLLYSKSCEIEDWRSLVWEITHISSTTTEDLITTRSRLDQREWWIGFYSWTTANR